jgi:hypothetical protein
MQETSRQGGWSTKSDLPDEAFLNEEQHRRSGSREVKKVLSLIEATCGRAVIAGSFKNSNF